MLFLLQSKRLAHKILVGHYMHEWQRTIFCGYEIVSEAECVSHLVSDDMAHELHHPLVVCR